MKKGKEKVKEVEKVEKVEKVVEKPVEAPKARVYTQKEIDFMRDNNLTSL